MWAAVVPAVPTWFPRYAQSPTGQPLQGTCLPTADQWAMKCHPPAKQTCVYMNIDGTQISTDLSSVQYDAILLQHRDLIDLDSTPEFCHSHIHHMHTGAGAVVLCRMEASIFAPVPRHTPFACTKARRSICGIGDRKIQVPYHLNHSSMKVSP